MLTLRVMTHPPFVTVNMPSEDIVLDWYKLVERGPADEPVSELLKRIAAEEARMMIAEVLWKPCHLANSADAPFGTPETWCWCRPDVIGAVIGSGTPAVGDPVNFAEPGEGIPWLTSQDPWQSSPTILMPLGIVLFSSRTTIGYRVWEARSGASPNQAPNYRCEPMSDVARVAS